MRYAYLLLLTSLALTSTATTAESPTFDRTAIDKLFARFAANDGPGCALGIADGAALIHAAGYGMANLEHGIALGPDSVFRIGSVSKQFTAAAIALLIEAGQLSLDDPLKAHLPELDEAVGAVSIAQALAHRGGLPDYDALEDLAVLKDAAGNLFSFGNEDHLTTAEFYQATLKLGLKHKPGSRFAYSNIGYFWLGQIVERVSGQSLAAYAEANLFEPAGMRHSFFNDSVTRLVPRRAGGYAPKDQGFEIFETNLDWVGDGGVYTSIRDFARWNEQFRTPTIGDEPDRLRKRLVSALGAVGPDNPKKPATYGYGLNQSVDEAGRPVLQHSGSWVAFRSMFKRYPEQDLAYWLFCNRPDVDLDHFTQRIEDVLLTDR